MGFGTALLPCLAALAFSPTGLTHASPNTSKGSEQGPLSGSHRGCQSKNCVKVGPRADEAEFLSRRGGIRVFDWISRVEGECRPGRRAYDMTDEQTIVDRVERYA